MLTHSTRGALLNVPRPLPDWSKLARHDSVIVVSSNGSTSRGIIDMIAIDRSVFWLIQGNGQGRMMVSASEGNAVIKEARKAL